MAEPKCPLQEKDPLILIEFGQKIPETQAREVAVKIVEAQAEFPDKIVPRKPELIEDLLKKGLVSYVIDRAGEIKASMFMEPIDDKGEVFVLGGEFTRNEKDGSSWKLLNQLRTGMKDKTLIGINLPPLGRTYGAIKFDKKELHDFIDDLDYGQIFKEYFQRLIDRINEINVEAGQPAMDFEHAIEKFTDDGNGIYLREKQNQQT